MSIEKTPAGTYRARWRDDQGRGRARNFVRKRDAQTFLDTVRADIARGTYIAPAASRVTVKHWADDWLKGALDLGPGGRDTYRRDLDRHILPVLGDLTLRQITADIVSDYLADELDAGLAASTVHRHYRTVRRMLEAAVERGKLPRNPCEHVKPPKLPRTEMRFLTAEQVEALAAAIGDRYRAWVYLAAYGGLRWSEGVGLRRAAVELDVPRIVVSEQLIRRADGQWHRSPPKTAAGRRNVKLPASIADILATHLEQFARPGDDGLVFPNQNGDPLNHPSFTANNWKTALERAGIDRATRIHDLRHTAVALAVAAGAHPKSIQARLGHASISVTLDRYGHLYGDVETKIAVELDAIRQSALSRVPHS